MDHRTVFRCALTTGLATLVVGMAAQDPPAVDDLLARVGDRIAEFYRRAQNVICIEKSTVQPIGWNYSPQGLARTVESELRVDSEPGYDNPAGEARLIREIRKVNGRLPRRRDKKDRSACTDPNPLSTEELAFLLPAHRSKYEFTTAGLGKDKDRPTLMIDFASINRKSRPELIEDPLGHDDCYDWSGPIAIKGRIWVDASTYEVVRIDRRLPGPLDVRVSSKLQSRLEFANWVVVEREDVTTRYKKVAFSDPDEVMLLPESIDSLIIVRGGSLQSTRRSQMFTDYRRFVTGGRIVKEN
jgi:hypothetical protein